MRTKSVPMFVYIVATVVSLWLVQHYRASRKWFQLPHPGFYVPGVSGGVKEDIGMITAKCLLLTDLL